MQLHKIISLFLVISLLVPLPTIATTTATSTDSSILTPATIEQVMTTENQGHGRLSLNLGMPKRVSRSPSGLIDLAVTPEVVFNRQLLELYARKLMLTSPIEHLSIDDQSIQMTVAAPARLLAVIPVQISREVTVNLAADQLDVTVENKTWWSWLTTKPAADFIDQQIVSQISKSRYLSITQLQSYILQAVLQVVTN